MITLRKIRKALGLSQEEMADLLGLSLGMLKQVEINKRKLPHRSQVILAWFQDELDKQETTDPVQVNPISPILIRKKWAQVEQKLLRWEEILEKSREKKQQQKVLESILPGWENEFGQLPNQAGRLRAKEIAFRLTQKNEQTKAGMINEQETELEILLLSWVKEKLEMLLLSGN